MKRRQREFDPMAVLVTGTNHDRRQKVPKEHHEMIRRAVLNGSRTRAEYARAYGVKHLTITKIVYPEKAEAARKVAAAWHAVNGHTPERKARRKVASKAAFKRKCQLVDQGVQLPQSKVVRTFRVWGTEHDRRRKYDPTSPQIVKLRQLAYSGKMSIAQAAREVGMQPHQAYPIVNRGEHRARKRAYEMKVGKPGKTTPEYRKELRRRKREILEAAKASQPKE